jgi:hypothetical protein
MGLKALQCVVVLEYCELDQMPVFPLVQIKACAPEQDSLLFAVAPFTKVPKRANHLFSLCAYRTLRSSSFDADSGELSGGFMSGSTAGEQNAAEIRQIRLQQN